jgi:micrococcal nuclease
MARVFLCAGLLWVLPACGSAREGPWVASSRGEVYYWEDCPAAARLSRDNLIRFPTSEAAERAGYRPSQARGCRGPEGPATAPAGTAAEPLGAVVFAAEVPPGRDCRVARVSDGDTLRCVGGEVVRLLMIDAPENSQPPYGAVAGAALRALTPPGSVVRLETDVRAVDRYHRTLAYVWLPDGRMANEEMARKGYAVALVYPPNVRHVERIRAAVVEAREARRGLWERDAFECLPRDHRAHRC